MKWFRERWARLVGRVALIDVLPDEISVSLESAGLSGATAVYAPFAPEDGARWHDAFAVDAEPTVRAVAVVRDRLLRIEGLGIQFPDGRLEAYNHANALHWRSLPAAAVALLFAEIGGWPTREGAG